MNIGTNESTKVGRKTTRVITYYIKDNKVLSI